MPDLRIPIRLGAHRVAAIALYRTLLTQCRAVPADQQWREEAQHIIRNRFRQARQSHSTRLLRISFAAGYEAVDHLDAAVAGRKDSLQYLKDLVEQAPSRIKLAPPTKLQIPEEKSKAFANPNRTSLLDRPIPVSELSGKRHIPVLVSASRIPILRIKKPQPANLSGFLHSRLEQRQERHDRRWRLYEEKTIAAHEDEWDILINRNVGESNARKVGQAISRQGLNRYEPTWTSAVNKGIVQVEQQLEDERQKNRVMAEKMQAVVDRERAIFEREKAERKRAKRKEYVQRRNKRRASEVTSDDHEGEQV